jgi:hypothetical protein
VSERKLQVARLEEQLMVVEKGLTCVGSLKVKRVLSH